MPISTINTSSIADDAVTVPKVTDQVLTHRNLIINGAMQVWQRGTSHSNTTDVAYRADRWMHQNRQSSQTDIALVENQEVVGEIMNSYKITVDTAPTDGMILINQYVENGAYSVAGKTITISWYAKQTTGSGVNTATNVEIDSGSTFTGTGSNNSLTSSWQRFTETFDVSSVSVSSISSPTLRHQIFFRSLSAGDVVEITGVQLEVGSVATPFEHRSYGEELALCQRYYWQIGDGVSSDIVGIGGNFGTVWAYFSGTFPVRMRTTPTTSVNNDTYFRCHNTSGSGINTDDFDAPSEISNTQYYISFSGVSSFTAGSSNLCFTSNTGGDKGIIKFDAEL